MTKTTSSLRFFILAGFFTLCFGDSLCQKQVTYVQVVKQATTAVSLTSSAGSIGFGQPVQFTANVAPATPTDPTGTVVFTATGTNPGNLLVSPPIQLGGSSTAVWATSFAVIDSYSVVAAYSGDSNYLASQSTPLAIQMTGSPDFAISTPSSATVKQGSSAAIPITVTSINGFSGSVALTCGGAPFESTCSFAAGMLTVPATNSALTTMTMTAAGTTVTTLGFLGFFVGWGALSRKRLRWNLLVCGGVALLLTTVTGCIGANRYVQTNGTPIGIYPISIVATSGAITRSSTTMLHVVAQ